MQELSAALAEFAANLKFDYIPKPVLRRAEDLFLDTVGSILAGAVERPVKSIDKYARLMGPKSGSAQNMVAKSGTSTLFAAMVNGAAAHMVEQDDVHNGAVFHPAAVVFPPALAVAQDLGKSGKEFLTAVVAGYEVGIRVGEYLGRSHYEIFHTTATAGTLAAAVTVGHLLNLNQEQMLNALGSAGTQSAGLWEFLRDGADSKQLHTAKACADGLMAAYLAKDGFTGARQILEGAKGMAAGMSTDADPVRLIDGLGSRWALLETSFKFHASCRHTHPAADALLAVMNKHDLSISDIDTVVAHVHQGAIDVLGAVIEPSTVHQSKFSMGSVLGLIAKYKRAGLTEFENGLNDPEIRNFCKRVSMQLDAEVDQAYPKRWIGKVTVTTKKGQVFDGRIDTPKGDPENTLSRAEIETKVKGLISLRQTATDEETKQIIKTIWDLENQDQIAWLIAN